MAKQNKNKTAESTTNWREAFIQFTLENNRVPASPYELAKFAGTNEEIFYETYSNINALASDIWNGFFEDTKNQIQADEQYQSFSVREKLLAFFYTWLENLRKYRSFIILVADGKKMWENKGQFDTFKTNFRQYAQELLNEAVETGEAENRNFLNQAYPSLLWANAMYLLRFWLKDKSKNFEQTDAAVEKITNVFFDLVGKTFLDSLFDFAKFAFQNR
jgi:hypothetical protein